MESTQQISEQERKRQERAKRFGLQAAEPKEGEQPEELPTVLPQVTYDEFLQNYNKYNRRQLEGMVIDRRQTVEEIEKEIKKHQERLEKFQTQTPESLLITERLQRKLEFARHKDAPRPIEKGSTIVPDAIYLYGVDYMNTFEIKTYFERYSTDKEKIVVSWINDSSCTIKFETDELFKKAYSELPLSGVNNHQTSLHIGQAVVDSKSEDVDERNFDAQLGWKEALGYQLKSNGRWQQLWFRSATDLDVKSEGTKGTDSRYYQIQKQRKERKLKQMGLFDPRYAKKGQDEIGNSNFLKKVIRKQNNPLGIFNKRGRREDSVSSEESKENTEKIQPTSSAVVEAPTEVVNQENQPDDAMEF